MQLTLNGRGARRGPIEASAKLRARRQTRRYRQDALAGGARVRILLRMRTTHPDTIYAAARSAAHSAAECQRIAAAYGLDV
jgi:hypothetical protein